MNIKNAVALLAAIILFPTFVSAQVVFPNRGGTGTSTTPTSGYVLVGQSDGTYGPQATATLGISGALGNDAVIPDYVQTTGQVDEYCLTYEATGATWEWQTCGSGGGGSGLATTSIDTEAELEAILTDVTNILTNNDTAVSFTNATSTNLAVTGQFSFLGTKITNIGTWFSGLFDTYFSAKDTDDLSEGSSNLYYTNARVDARINATSTIGTLTSAPNLSITESQISDLAHYTDSDTADYINGSTTLLRSANEAGLETYLSDVSDVFTNNDGALADDDLSDDDFDALQNVAAMTESAGDLLYYTSGAWRNLAAGTDGEVLKVSGGVPGWSTDLTGGGNGLSTSTPFADTYIPYGTSVSTLGSEAAFTYDDATNLLTVENASTTLLTVSGTLWADLTGNADTATALAANGANCSAGSLAGGVDASGAAEDCTDVWTEAENTAAAYLDSADIGVTIQGYDAGLASIAGLTTAADRMIYTTAADTYAVTTLSTFGRSLIDDAAASNARTTLGLGSLATLSTISNSNWSGTDLSVANGGTGASTLTQGGVLYGNGTGAITNSGVLTNGQLLIGDGTTFPTVATLTAGTGIGVSNGAGSITLSADLGTAITSGEITDDEIVNADINSAAAIAYSKLNLTNAILEADLKAVNSPTDEYCLTYETTTGDFEWQACGTGGAGDTSFGYDSGSDEVYTATSTSGVRAAYFKATSTTATSTFAGSVGIGTTTPQALLHIDDATTTANTVFFGGPDTICLAIWGNSSSSYVYYLPNDSGALTATSSAACGN